MKKTTLSVLTTNMNQIEKKVSSYMFKRSALLFAMSKCDDDLKAVGYKTVASYAIDKFDIDKSTVSHNLNTAMVAGLTATVENGKVNYTIPTFLDGFKFTAVEELCKGCKDTDALRNRIESLGITNKTSCKDIRKAIASLNGKNDQIAEEDEQADNDSKNAIASAKSEEEDASHKKAVADLLEVVKLANNHDDIMNALKVAFPADFQ